MSKPVILVTFDSMKDINRGYFSFGKGLGDALIQQNRDRFKLKYYLFKKTPYLFNNKVDILYLSKLHRIFFPARNQFELVHLSERSSCRKLLEYSASMKLSSP